MVAEPVPLRLGDLLHEMVAQGMYAYDDLRGSATLPSWVRPEKLQRGQDFLREHGLEIASALFCGSLPFSRSGC